MIICIIQKNSLDRIHPGMKHTGLVASGAAHLSINHRIELSTMRELFSAVIFEITIIGIAVLFVPLAYKIWKQLRKQETLFSTIRFSLIGLVFIFVWILVGVASSIWIAFLAAPFGGPRQAIIAQIWQSIWIFAGLILSISNRATLGAIFGSFFGVLTAIEAGSIVGFLISFVVGLWSDTYSHGLGDKLFSSFMVGIFGAIFVSFCAVLFISVFTTLGGAILGLFADAFGKTGPYEKLLQRFRINSN